MSDIKLFEISNKKVAELTGKSVALEKSLQTLMEKNLESLLGVQFLASEYSTGKVHGGRIDTLGIDENKSPVIIEYKRAANENVINQGLYYLDWLLDHKAEFELLVMNKVGKEISREIEWSSPRLLCIAGDFTKYDAHATQQMGRNIELIRYRQFDNDLLLLELVNAATDTGSLVFDPSDKGKKGTNKYTTVTESLSKASAGLCDVYEALKSFLMALGDDVQIKTLKYYFAFKRIKNFACVEVHTSSNKLAVYVKADMEKIRFEKGFTRDVTNIGHLGTGNLEITITSSEDLKKAEQLLTASYEMS